MRGLPKSEQPDNQEWPIWSFGVPGHAFWCFQRPGQLSRVHQLAEMLDVFVFVYLDSILIYIEDPVQGYVEAV